MEFDNSRLLLNSRNVETATQLNYQRLRNGREVGLAGDQNLYTKYLG